MTKLVVVRGDAAVRVAIHNVFTGNTAPPSTQEGEEVTVEIDDGNQAFISGDEDITVSLRCDKPLTVVIRDTTTGGDVETHSLDAGSDSGGGRISKGQVAVVSLAAPTGVAASAPEPEVVDQAAAAAEAKPVPVPATDDEIIAALAVLNDNPTVVRTKDGYIDLATLNRSLPNNSAVSAADRNRLSDANSFVKPPAP